MVEAGATQKASKQHQVPCGLKCSKSIVFQDMLCMLLNLGYFELTVSILTKLVEPGQRKISWKKGGFT